LRWLITGAAGFVGRNLVEVCEDRAIEALPLRRADADLRSREETLRAFERAAPADVIVHLASVQGAGTFPATHPASLLRVNLEMGLNVLEAWRSVLPAARMIVLGTSCGYPGDHEDLREEMFLSGGIHPSVAGYGDGKRLLYVALRSYCQEFGLQGAYLVPATMFGPHDDFSTERAHVVGALLGRFMRAIRDGASEVSVWGSGRQVRDFIYVNDFARIVVELVPQLGHDIVNVGPGVGIAVRDLVDEIVSATGYAGTVVFDQTQYEGTSRKSINTERLRREYGLRPLRTIGEALRETVNWLQANPAALSAVRPPPF
jgi:GDP-L-fucose synthase